ncbi:unnamed protein product [Heterobilharzia americana]|nr:unnamed protein product [Heterobilharzia americana]
MRLRSSLRKTNKPIECPKENVHVKPKPTAKADNSRHKNDDILQSRTAFSKSCPPVRTYVSTKNPKKGKRNLNINAFLEDPYLFVDDSDDDKENIDPNDFKTKHVSTHVSDGSIPVISKGALCNLNPQNSSTPSTSNPTTGLQISVGPHGVIPTPINYPLNKRSNEIRDNSIECIADHPLQIDPICTSNTVASDVDKDDTSSKDASKESTSSSGRRRKKESESERQKAYESWLDEFNAELQKYESFELSVENVSQTTDH